MEKAKNITIIPSRKQLRNIWRQRMKNKLGREEKEILDAYENDEFVEFSDIKTEIKKHVEYAKATFRKNKRINIRISQKDLESVQGKAIEETRL